MPRRCRHHDDVERPGTVHALDKLELDVAGRRGATDPRRGPDRVQPVEDVRNVPDYRVLADDAHVQVGDEREGAAAFGRSWVKTMVPVSAMPTVEPVTAASSPSSSVADSASSRIDPGTRHGSPSGTTTLAPLEGPLRSDPRPRRPCSEPPPLGSRRRVCRRGRRPARGPPRHGHGSRGTREAAPVRRRVHGARRPGSARGRSRPASGPSPPGPEGLRCGDRHVARVGPGGTWAGEATPR